MRAEIITPWIGDGLDTDTARRPKLLDDYPAITRYSDVTGQPAPNLHPDPNLYTINCELDQATLDAIELDTGYVVGWVE